MNASREGAVIQEPLGRRAAAKREHAVQETSREKLKYAETNSLAPMNRAPTGTLRMLNLEEIDRSKSHRKIPNIRSKSAFKHGEKSWWRAGPTRGKQLIRGVIFENQKTFDGSGSFFGPKLRTQQFHLAGRRAKPVLREIVRTAMELYSDATRPWS